jgi:hypothetical protein
MHRLKTVSAFSIEPVEQEAPAKANKKKHKITLISNLLIL